MICLRSAPPTLHAAAVIGLISRLEDLAGFCAWLRPDARTLEVEQAPAWRRGRPLIRIDGTDKSATRCRIPTPEPAVSLEINRLRNEKGHQGDPSGPSRV
jgi:hypothetical protein